MMCVNLSNKFGMIVSKCFNDFSYFSVIISKKLLLNTSYYTLLTKSKSGNMFILFIFAVNI